MSKKAMGTLVIFVLIGALIYFWLNKAGAAVVSAGGGASGSGGGTQTPFIPDELTSITGGF